MRIGARRVAAGAATVIALAAPAACVGGGRAQSTTTTTTTSTVTLPSTTTTTLAKTSDPAFHTRELGVLTVATDHADSPYFVVDPQSGVAYDGYEYDIARALASRLGLGRVRLVYGSLEAIEEGFDCDCDVYFGGAVVTAALARHVDLSVPYVDANPAVLMRAGSAAPTIATAPPLRWALVATDVQALTVVTHRFEPATDPERLVSPEAVVHAVAAGDVDAALLPAPVALLAARADPTLTVVGKFDVGATWAAVEPLGSSNSPSLTDWMGKLADDGTLAFISRRHLGINPAGLPLIG